MSLELQYGLEIFDYYLYARHFVLITDHEALTYLDQHQSRNTRLGRLAALLQNSYDFTVKYKKGRLHANADALSRQPAGPGVQETSKLGDCFLDHLPALCFTGESHRNTTATQLTTAAAAMTGMVRFDGPFGTPVAQKEAEKGS